MIKAVILDLDNCLAKADELGPQLLAPTFEAIRQANQGTLPEEALLKAFNACWHHPLDWVAGEYGFSEEMLAAGVAANAQTEIRVRMHGYPDLDVLAHLGVRLFLVTTGFKRMQAGKIQALGIQALFERIEIDAIDEPDRKGKAALFADILATTQLLPTEALVVGDSAESEIAAGNALGIPTVQILRPGVVRTQTATHVITSLAQLPETIRRYS